jgi:hypothetical protein
MTSAYWKDSIIYHRNPLKMSCMGDWSFKIVSMNSHGLKLKSFKTILMHKLQPNYPTKQSTFL